MTKRRTTKKVQTIRQLHREVRYTLIGMSLAIVLIGIPLLAKVDEFGLAGLTDLSTFNLRWNDEFWEKLDSLRSKGGLAYLGDTTFTQTLEYAETYTDSELYTVDLLKQEGVKFPYIHGVIMLLKETSFCRDETERGVPTLCSSNWNHIFPENSGITHWNPYNYSGMKHPSNRKTTSVGSIGNILRHMEVRYGFRVVEPYRSFLINDPHAVFMSPRDHAKDLALWQKSRLKRFKPAKTDSEYIEQLRAAGYNPFSKYYDHPTRGLYALLRSYKSGEFSEKYGTLYQERMGSSLPPYEP